MKQDDIEIALQRRNIVKQLSQIDAGTQMEKIKGALALSAGRKGSDGALFGGAGEARQKFCAGLLFFGIVGKRKNFRREPRLKITTHGGPGKIQDIGNDAMTGENDQILATSVDESHHGALVVGVGIG